MKEGSRWGPRLWGHLQERRTGHVGKGPQLRALTMGGLLGDRSSPESRRPLPSLWVRGLASPPVSFPRWSEGLQ